MNKHVLPPLAYDISALEPHINAHTMHLHHDVHHAAYVKALNVAVSGAPEVLQGKTAGWLLRNLAKVPPKLRTAVSNNAGGHLNHSLLWRAMAPNSGGAPSGALAEAVEHAFDSFEKFKANFVEAGSAVFGSGWVWLVRAQHGDEKLQVLTTAGHDNPLVQGYIPLLVNDVWEHAYYLQHENRRQEYLKDWWPVVNWKEAARRYERALLADAESMDDGRVAAAAEAA